MPKVKRSNSTVSKNPSWKSIRLRVEELALRGMSAEWIAHSEGRTITQIRNHLKAIRKQWKVYIPERMDEYRQAIRQVETILVEAWRGWHRSIAENAKSSKTVVKDIERTTIAQQSGQGNPSYLRLALDCIKCRQSILDEIARTQDVESLKGMPLEVRIEDRNEAISFKRFMELYGKKSSDQKTAQGKRTKRGKS